MTLVGGSRNDPVYNRIADDIHQAVRQFDAVNPDLEHPNVLAFLNDPGSHSDYGDLIGVLTGQFLRIMTNVFRSSLITPRDVLVRRSHVLTFTSGLRMMDASTSSSPILTENMNEIYASGSVRTPIQF